MIWIQTCAEMSVLKCLTSTTTSVTPLYRYGLTTCDAMGRKHALQTVHMVLGADTTAVIVRMSPSRALVRFYLLISQHNDSAFYIHVKKDD